MLLCHFQANINSDYCKIHENNQNIIKHIIKKKCCICEDPIPRSQKQICLKHPFCDFCIEEECFMCLSLQSE